MRKIFLSAVLIVSAIAMQAQLTADQIIDKYFETIGGKEKWEQLEGVKITGKTNSQGMEMPIEIVRTKGGKQYVSIEIQGKKLKMGVWDGEKLWNTNFMTMEPEKMDSETTENFKKGEMLNFPSPFLHYREKGYTVELDGEDTIEGTACYKIKLTQKPVTLNGKEYPSIVYYYFDKENFVLIASEQEILQGTGKGQKVKTHFSDYQEVDGLYFPFSIGGSMVGGNLTVDKIEINPEIPDSEFTMPEKKEETPQEKH